VKKDLIVIDFFRVRPLLSLLTGGVFFFGILLSDIPTMIVSPGWPTTTGSIISRRYVGQKYKEYDGDYYTNIDGYIRYQYSVDDEQYTSNGVNSVDTPFYPHDIVVHYPEGKDVIVYYNPNDPSEAVLEPGIVLSLKAFDIDSEILVGAGIYFMSLGSMELIRRGKQDKLNIV